MSPEKLTASTSLKFDNLTKLLGQSNYVLWSNCQNKEASGDEEASRDEEASGHE